jgi:hypothetical protein
MLGLNPEPQHGRPRALPKATSLALFIAFYTQDNFVKLWKALVEREIG